jgi:hypothetical protein
MQLIQFNLVDMDIFFFDFFIDGLGDAVDKSRLKQLLQKLQGFVEVVGLFGFVEGF